MNSSKDWREYFRLITPFMIAILTFVGWTIGQRLDKVDRGIAELDKKLFVHLTNDEIHTPKSIVVNKAEFTMYQIMRDRQMDDLRSALSEIKQMIGKK